MTDTSSTAVVVAPAPNPRWIPLVTVILGIIGTAALAITALTTIGAWRATVDQQIAELKTRMDKAEDNQRTYIPVLIGLSKDVTYLADRARREDEKRDRAER